VLPGRHRQPGRLFAQRITPSRTLRLCPFAGRLRLRRLPSDDRILARAAPVIFPGLPVAAYHPVTRDQEGHRIGAYGRTHGPDRLRMLYLTRHFRVGRQPAQRNLQQSLPYLYLKSRALQMQLDPSRLTPVPGKDRQRLFLYRIACRMEMRIRKLTLQPLKRGLFRAVDERHMTDTLIRRGDQQPAERALGKAVIDMQRFPAVLVFTRRHAFDLDEEIVQPARARQTRFECRISQGCTPGVPRTTHGPRSLRSCLRRASRPLCARPPRASLPPTARSCRIFQYTLGMLQRKVLQELLRRHPRPFPEHPLEMERAQMDMLRHCLERRLILEICFIKSDSLRDPVVIDRCLCRLHD